MTKPDADEGKLYLRVFAYRPTVPMAGDLEGRMKRFLSSSPLNENLDDPQFAAATGSSFKADYLLSSRAIIAELKALQLGTAKQRVEDRLRVRFARRDAPMVFGTMNVSSVIDDLDDSEEIYALLNALNSRALRERLKHANKQIGNIRNTLSLHASSGMVIVLNDKEPMTTVQNLASTIHLALTEPKDRHPNVKFVWAIVETHSINTPNGSLGFPMFVAWRGQITRDEQLALSWLVGGWATANAADLCELPNDLEVMTPVYPHGAPIISPFRP
tara:strand:- start:802 stop:1620 length:819 start_codon:yes stop_codon:yes gene_type:complete